MESVGENREVSTVYHLFGQQNGARKKKNKKKTKVTTLMKAQCTGSAICVHFAEAKNPCSLVTINVERYWIWNKIYFRQEQFIPIREISQFALKALLSEELWGALGAFYLVENICISNIFLFEQEWAICCSKDRLGLVFFLLNPRRRNNHKSL